IRQVFDENDVVRYQRMGEADARAARTEAYGDRLFTERYAGNVIPDHSNANGRQHSTGPSFVLIRHGSVEITSAPLAAQSLMFETILPDELEIG
ncbi:MAG TPA: hypothetical protein VGW37_18955, partial [Terriglobia bacterium]|nr:hypothetical protein [Terriglobia bacterium]